MWYQTLYQPPLPLLCSEAWEGAAVRGCAHGWGGLLRARLRVAACWCCGRGSAVPSAWPWPQCDAPPAAAHRGPTGAAAAAHCGCTQWCAAAAAATAAGAVFKFRSALAGRAWTCCSRVKWLLAGAETSLSSSSNTWHRVSMCWLSTLPGTFGPPDTPLYCCEREAAVGAGVVAWGCEGDGEWREGALLRVGEV
eukprot:1161135-Pelagomonas_calceolata.AAC.10